MGVAVVAVLGGMGLAFGLVAMYGLLMQQQRDLARLEELLAGKDREEALKG